MTRVFIGLGSNLDHPETQVETALRELATLPETQLLASSRRYRSRAQGPVQPDYVNAVALLDTQLDPLRLLDELQALEQAHQRVRLEHWGPRTLDLDILLIENQHIHCERLQVPHAYLSQRNFVVYPLADIAPDLILPSGETLSQLMQQLGSEGLELITQEAP